MYLNPADADKRLRELLNSRREEECDGEAHSTVEGHRHKHTTGGDSVAQQHMHSEGYKQNDLAGREERGHVEAPQIRAGHYLGDFFPENTIREQRKKVTQRKSLLKFGKKKKSTIYIKHKIIIKKTTTTVVHVCKTRTVS